jgi:hypothetical protein
MQMPLTAPTPHSGPLVDLKMIREPLEQHRAARIDQIKAYTLADLDAGGATLDPAARRRALTAARLALDELDLALARLDDEWWNNRRLHSSIGNILPAEAEAEHYRLNPATRPAALTT